MIKNTMILLLILSPLYADELRLIREWRFGSYGSDVWGYKASDGTQYAIYGVSWGIAIVNVNTLSVADTIQLDSCLWRDFKTYRNYLYAVEDCWDNPGIGILIIDLSPLPDSVRYVKSYTDQGGHFHNIYIDTATATLLAANGNIKVMDISDPENPVAYTPIPTSVHDIYARNDTVYVAEGTNSFSIWDITDKSNPTLIVRKDIPGGWLVHNIWVNDDRTLAITTEEDVYRTVKIWDISDLNNIILLGEYLGANSLAHNAYIFGDKAFISHYGYGVVVLDISDPMNPLEVAHYDTYDPCWGVYPFTDGGYVYASGMDGYLYILKYDSIPLNAREVENIGLNLEKPSTVNIYDASGRKIFSTKIKGKFVWKPKKRGVYFYEVKREDGVFRGKMMYLK